VSRGSTAGAHEQSGGVGVVDGVLRERALARWHRLQRGSGERERRRECGECERALGMKRGGGCSTFIEGGEEREREGRQEEEMVAGGH
jgi:hypothetical protein